MNWRVYVKQHPRFGPWYQRVDRAPSWAVKAAVIAAMFVIVVPVVALTIAAVAVGLVVFGLLSIIVWGAWHLRLLWRRLTGADGRHAHPQTQSSADAGAGRVNVRVIHRG